MPWWHTPWELRSKVCPSCNTKVVWDTPLRLFPRTPTPLMRKLARTWRSTLSRGVAGAASEELLTEELSELPGKDMAGVAKMVLGLEDTGAPGQAEYSLRFKKTKKF